MMKSSRNSGFGEKLLCSKVMIEMNVSLSWEWVEFITPTYSKQLSDIRAENETLLPMQAELVRTMDDSDRYSLERTN